MYGKTDKMKYTPVIRQYLSIKEKYPEMLIFFRLGDFYELFFNDAVIASKELEIVLTGKNAGVKERVPMCGVPYHSVESYLDRLTKKGFKIVIVEQMEDPSLSKGIVKREVVRIITPGTVTEGMTLEPNDYNFISAVERIKDGYLLAYCDLTTGENYLTSLPADVDLLRAELLKLKTKETVVSPSFNKSILESLNDLTQLLVSVHEDDHETDYMSPLTEDLDSDEKRVFGRLFNYIFSTQKKIPVHMQKVIKYTIDGFMRIDLPSRRNLELLETLRFQNKKNTLNATLDKCVTAMGSRFLKKNIIFPSVDIRKLNERYDIIKKMNDSFSEADELRRKLASVYDLERLVGRISYENANPRELVRLSRSVGILPEIISLTEKIGIERFFSLDFNSLSGLCKLLDEALSPDAPQSPKEIGIIKAGYDKILDELNEINRNGKDYLFTLERKEREKTGIKSLKIGYNRVFGYYLEIPKGSISQIKEEYGYVRRQTLFGSERYITPELKEKEAMILRADEKARELEYKLFVSVRSECKQYTRPLQRLARQIAELDMLLSFAWVAKENNYVRPVLNKDGIIDIKRGRHPVVEQSGEEFIPNDLKMDSDDSVLLITGPNMSGKSTYMRQTALIAVMAQIGSYVPAAFARLPIFDAVYTRIGAADDIVSGQSTFMVEMNEVNNALRGATKNSLIIFDEIGRGTATYDGMALAQAIIEYIDREIKCKTLFSTHYHELTALASDLEHLKNVHVNADEINGEIVFLHRVTSGSAKRSYGINVAKLARIPDSIVLRAEDILNKLEMSREFTHADLSPKNYQAPLIFDSKTEKESYVLNKLKETDIYQMNPLEAMNLFADLQKDLKKKG